MIERIGPIKNPLTIIAIFAGIAEVSGTVVLPFIAASNQQLFIYFLIAFPVLLVILFFLTLNFNNKVLYAPSDYQDEERFLRVMRFDQNKMREVDEGVISLRRSLAFKTRPLISSTKTLNSFNKGRQPSIRRGGLQQEISISVSAFVDVNKLLAELRASGFSAEVYERSVVSLPAEHKSIWLGKDVPIDVARTVITMARQFYPHLEYIHMSDDGPPDAPEYVHQQIYIGGSTETAMGYGCRPLSAKDFEKIATLKTVSELHEFVRSFYL